MAAADRTRKLALGGILLALSMGLLYLKILFPVLDYTIFVLISFFTGIMLQESGHRWAWLFFASTVVLSLVLPVNKLELLLYYSFFGFYGILKFYIEKLRRRLPEFLLKVLLINAAAIMNYLLAAELFELPEGNVGLYLFMAVATVFVFIYDYVYTLAMAFYEKRISGLVRRS